VIGAGFAGAEVAYYLAERGVRVELVDMKPKQRTAAARYDFFTEMVCSNSFRSQQAVNAVGLLKEEMRALGSLTQRLALEHAVPAGDALAVDRVSFGEAVTRVLRQHPCIEVVCGEVMELPCPGHPVVIATGPLTGEKLAEALREALGEEQLYFYDALAPIIAGDSIDRDVAFQASRYDKGNATDYWNLPLNRAEYEQIVAFLKTAERFPGKEFEKLQYFAGCMPMEAMADTGAETLRFGPWKPVGLRCPRTGERPYAVVQLRAEDKHAHAFNLVGCQTRLRQGEQRRWLEMLPGLKNIEILRYGAMHRNTYVCAPRVLDEHMRLPSHPWIYLAGQICGVEGYVESAAHGMCVGQAVYHDLVANRWYPPPTTTALGALWGHTRGVHQLSNRHYEPQNVHWGLFAPLRECHFKKGADKKMKRVVQARADWSTWQAQHAVALGA
jgi:methylenetetrahydrofolate--tRNA-(uracil-5-)-methyltransferase